MTASQPRRPAGERKVIPASTSRPASAPDRGPLQPPVRSRTSSSTADASRTIAPERRARRGRLPSALGDVDGAATTSGVRLPPPPAASRPSRGPRPRGTACGGGHGSLARQGLAAAAQRPSPGWRRTRWCRQAASATHPTPAESATEEAAEPTAGETAPPAPDAEIVRPTDAAHAAAAPAAGRPRQDKHGHEHDDRDDEECLLVHGVSPGRSSAPTGDRGTRCSRVVPGFPQAQPWPVGQVSQPARRPSAAVAPCSVA